MLPQTVNENILILVVQGRLQYTMNQATLIAEKGDLVFIPKGTYRGAENYMKEPHQKFSALFHHTIPSGTVPLLDKPAFTKTKVRNFEYIKKRFEALHREHLEGKPMHRFIGSGILQELIGIASRDVETGEISPMKWQQSGKIQQYITANYRRTIHAKELAEQIGRSTNYTISLFKEVTGQTPVQYQRHLRITEARSLLLNTAMTVAEISEYLGFYDSSYFYRTFKKETSLSPSAFIALCEKEKDPAGEPDPHSSAE
jgi:AraC-like DNA-binding protein